MKICGFIFALNDWDDQNDSGILKFKNKIIEFLNPNDLFIVFPKTEVVEIGDAVATVFNNNTSVDDLFLSISYVIKEFNKLNESLVKKLFVFSNYTSGIGDFNDKLLDKINKSYTQLFLLGINKDVKNFVYLPDINDIYNIIREELADAKL